jgi:hypothetical protein
MNDFKSYASRSLNEMGVDSPNRKRWTRHGSTRYLWKPQDVCAALQYVTKDQGEPLSMYERLD